MHDPIIVRNAILPGTAGLSDLLLVDERIAAVGPRLTADGIEEFDALGLTALPGGVDSMMHVGGAGGAGEPADDLGSGTAAAVLGGTTAILAVIPAAEHRVGSFEAALARARTGALIDYGLMIEVPAFDEMLVADLALLAPRDAFAGIVVALDALPQTISDLGAILAAAARTEVGVTVRTGGRRGAAAERQRILAIAQLAGLADAAVHVAPLASAAAALTVDATPLTAAVGLAHLTSPGLPAGCAVVPPLPTPAEQRSLWGTVRSGAVSEIVTDHCAPPLRGGAGHVGLGIASVRLAALHARGVVDGHIDLARLAEITATAAARRLRLAGRGAIEVGAMADVVLFDPLAEWTVERRDLEGRGGVPAFEGQTLTGRVRHVFARGTQIVRDGSVHFRPGRGRPLRFG